jgi:5,10-methylenetetrahydromethanopterin reductase
VADRLAELAGVGVDEFSAVVFDSSPDVRERTRALLRSLDT